MASWISVKDRLPEKDGAYLVCQVDPYNTDHIGVGIAKFSTNLLDAFFTKYEFNRLSEDGKRWAICRFYHPGFFIEPGIIDALGERDVTDINELIDVYYWMPLPEPPSII